MSTARIPMTTPSHADFLALRDRLRHWIASNDIELLRDIVRMAFHDLINTNADQGGLVFILERSSLESRRQELTRRA